MLLKAVQNRGRGKDRRPGRESPFNPEPQRLAAGGKHGQPWTFRQQPGDARGGSQDVLDVVQNEEHAADPQRRPAALGRGHARNLAHVQCLGNGRQDERRVGDGRQRHEDGAARCARSDSMSVGSTMRCPPTDSLPKMAAATANGQSSPAAPPGSALSPPFEAEAPGR